MARLPLEVRRSQFAVLTGFGLRLALAVATAALVAASVPPASFAFFGLVAAVFVLVQLSFDAGTHSQTVHEIARGADAHASVGRLRAWRIAVAGGWSIAFCVWAFLEADSMRRSVGLAAALTCGALVAGAGAPLLQARQQFRTLEGVRVASQGLTLAGCALFRWLDLPPDSFALWILVRALTNAQGIGWKTRQLLGRVRADWSRLNALLPRAWSQGLALAALAAPASVALLYARALGDGAELARLAAATQLFQPLATMPALWATPLLPLFSASWSSPERADYGAQLRRACALAAFGGLAGAAAIATAAPVAIGLLFGDTYVDGTTEALQRFAVAFAASSLAAPLALAALARGERLALLGVVGLASIVQLGWTLLQFEKRGILAAAEGAVLQPTLAALLLAGLALRRPRQNEGHSELEVPNSG